MTRAFPSAFPLAALLALAACGTTAPRTPEEACRAEARNTPAVREAEQRVNPAVENPNSRARVEGEAAAAERRAYLQCMRVRGLSPPGAGVEPRQPY